MTNKTGNKGKKYHTKKDDKKAGKVEYVDIPLSLIDMPDMSMRQSMDGDGMESLAASIKAHGLINPITVRKRGSRYEVVAGSRRRFACDMIGLSAVKCKIEYSDDATLEIIKIHENILREDVKIYDEAVYLESVVNKLKLTQAKLAKLIGKSEAYVSDRLKILKWDDYLRDALHNGDITFSAARELSTIKNDGVRKEYTRHAVKSGITPTTAKQWAADANAVADPVISDDQSGDGEYAPASPSMPKFDCFSCQSPTDVTALQTLRVCASCAAALKSAASDTPKESAS